MRRGEATTTTADISAVEELEEHKTKGAEPP